jgi:hypothetical protein
MTKAWTIPTDAPENPEVAELAAQLAGVASPPTSSKIVRARPKPTIVNDVGAELVARRAVQRDVRERLIRVSGHVPKEKQFVIRKAAADRNMSVDAFVVACIDAVLRSQGLLEESDGS